MRRFCMTGLLVIALTSCKDFAGANQIMVRVSVIPNHIVPGDTATIVVRLTNLAANAITIPDRCDHPFEIRNAQGDIVVGNTPVYCTLELRAPEVLKPFESIERRFTWTGKRLRLEGSTWVSEPVTTGLYRVYARFDGHLSAPDTVEVDPVTTP